MVMVQDAAQRRRTSLRRETGSYTPRNFTRTTRERFLRDRRQRHLGRIPGQPSEAQIAEALTMANLEWNAVSAEHQNTLQSLREAREHRRLLLRVLGDFEKSLEKPAAKPTIASGRAALDAYNVARIAARAAVE
jgi:hypothetical protein